MPICKRCSSTIQKLRPQGLPNLQEDLEVNVTLPIFQPAAVCGCWICSKFSQWLETENFKLFMDWRRRSLRVKFSAFARAHFEQPQQDVLLPYIMDIVVQAHDSDDASCEVKLHFVPASGMTFPVMFHVVWQGETNPSVDIPAHTATVPKRHGAAGFDPTVVKTWIEICTRNHEKCRGNSEPWYPSRLLHIGRQCRKVKLIISKDSPPNGRYMTLSHRWGPQSYTKLESSTMAQLQNTVNIISLPQIFQDAIKIACHLGIHYLWIDALCIKQDQDDLSDWENESQNMGKIYSCAFLNVSATLSLDGSESLFRDPSWRPILPSEIDLDDNGILRKYHVLDGDIWYDEIDNAPLNKRGWVFQERFLARRVLHFGQRQMGWECRELDALEMFPNGLPQAAALSIPSKSSIHGMLATLTQESDQTLDETFVKQWHDLVTEYSKCRLTYSKDKLIAFAGVAKSIMRTKTDHYVAGMWRKSMVYDLAWWRSSEDRKAFPISETSFRVPSWSWASVDGEVHFPDIFGDVWFHFTIIREVSGPIMNGSSAFAECSLIRVEGVCLPLSVEWLDGEIASFEVVGFRFPMEDDPQGSMIDLEGPEQDVQKLVQQAKVLLLPLFATSYSLYGILLTKIRGIGAHRRLGAVEIWIRTGSVSHKNASGEENTFWNKAAVNLIHYVREKQHVRMNRIIDIY